MTTVTVVAEDRRMIVNGEVLEFDFSLDPLIWAIQWDGSKGHIEYRDGRMPKMIDDSEEITPYLDAFFREKERRMHEREEEERQQRYARVRDPAARKADLASIRWQRETQGIVVNGVPVDTSREAQATLAALKAYASDLSPEDRIDFKSKSGWISLPACTVVVIAQAVLAYVQACYSHEKIVSQRIDALTDQPESLADLDLSQGWPDNTIA